MHERLDLLLPSGREIALTIGTANVDTHSFFSLYPEAWRELIQRIRGEAREAADNARVVARADGTGVP